MVAGAPHMRPRMWGNFPCTCPCAGHWRATTHKSGHTCCEDCRKKQPPALAHGAALSQSAPPLQAPLCPGPGTNPR